jgi:hypothetical protein
MGAATPIMDPSRWARRLSRERGVVGRGHAPVMAVLLVSAIALLAHIQAERARDDENARIMRELGLD